MVKQTLTQATYLAVTGKSANLMRAAWALHGLPAGEWPETREAFVTIEALLPWRDDREYSVAQFINEMYGIEAADAKSSGRYRSKLHKEEP